MTVCTGHMGDASRQACLAGGAFCCVILDGSVAGASNKVIAFDLGLSVRTVDVHRARMMERLGTRQLAEAIRLAVLATSAAAPAAPPPIDRAGDGLSRRGARALLPRHVVVWQAPAALERRAVDDFPTDRRPMSWITPCRLR